jgi:hypothetical protein
MQRTHDTMMNPPIEELLDRVDSKFSLVTLAARRARRSTPTSASSVTASAHGPAAGQLRRAACR